MLISRDLQYSSGTVLSDFLSDFFCSDNDRVKSKGKVTSTTLHTDLALDPLDKGQYYGAHNICPVSMRGPLPSPPSSVW